MVELDTVEEEINCVLHPDVVVVDTVVVGVGFGMLTLSSHLCSFHLTDLSQKTLEQLFQIARSFDLVVDYVVLVLRFPLTPLPTTNSIPRDLDLSQHHHFHRLQ